MLQKLKLKQQVEQILHVPGNYRGGILEITLVCDYAMSQEKLIAQTKELADTLKRQSEVFRNVRVNVVKWVSDNKIITQVMPLSYFQMGLALKDYDTLQEDKEGHGTEKTVQELTRQLKLFHARSKVVFLLTEGQYEIGNYKKVKEHLYPFLYRKLLVLENEEQIMGMQWMKNLQKTIVFDMDGVLFDTERIYLQAYEEVAKSWGIENIRPVVLACIGRNGADTKTVFLERMGSDFPYEKFAAESKECAKDLLAKDLPIKKGVLELLSYLQQEEYQLALASSTRTSRVEELLEQKGLKKYFTLIIGGDMVEHSKPNPQIYRLACAKLGVDPAKTYAIEDSENGIRAAFGAGMQAIMVPDLLPPSPEVAEMTTYICEDLIEVKYHLAGKSIHRLPMEGLYNTRDLGGMVTMDGRIIRPHRLLRSGTLFSSTEKDRQILLEECGLKTVVDFRTQIERSEKPDPELTGVTNLWNPILEESAMGITREEGDKAKQGMVQQVLAQTKGQEDGPSNYMQDMYRNLVLAPYCRKQYKAFFQILLSQEAGSTLWHCSAGKDRVGVATALLLSALGVPREMIVADYMKTNEFGAGEVKQLLARVEEELRPRVKTLFIVSPDFLGSVFQVIEENFGGMDNFLEQEMGLTPENREKLQDMYLQ